MQCSPSMKNFTQFHDGFFDGLWIDSTRVHIYLSTLQKERFTAVADGVVRLFATGIKEGNIIFDVVVRDHDELTPDDISAVYDLAGGTALEEKASRLLDKAREEKWVLLEISPSYGANCLILARRVDVVEGTTPSQLPTEN